MADEKLHPCTFCQAPDADVAHFQKHHPAPQPFDGRAAYQLDWMGHVYVSHAAQHMGVKPTGKENQ